MSNEEEPKPRSLTFHAGKIVEGASSSKKHMGMLQLTTHFEEEERAIWQKAKDTFNAGFTVFESESFREQLDDAFRIHVLQVEKKNEELALENARLNRILEHKQSELDKYNKLMSDFQSKLR